MDLQSAGVKREIQWAELNEWRKKAYHSSKLYKGADEKMISGSRSSISSWEIRYYSLVPTFICSVW